VEPEGFEPSSKQGNNEPSTCLDLLDFGVATVVNQGYCHLSSLIFAIIPEQYNGYPVIYDASIGTPAGGASRET